MFQIISIILLMLCIYIELLGGQKCPPNPENIIIFIDSCPTEEADYITDIGKGSCNIDHAEYVLKTYKLAGGKKKIWLITASRKEKYENPYIVALNNALKCNIKVISTSTSSSLKENGYIKLEESLINKFVSKGGRYYAAAGNYGKNLMIYPVYPAAYENVIAIGAKSCNNENPEGYSIAKYSNYGPKVKYWHCGQNPILDYMHGTSYSTPRIVANKEG